KGKVTKMVAMMIPTAVKMMWIPCAFSHGPNHPCAPNNSTKMRPETTGDTENGKSIKVTRTFFPGKRHLATHQAAATPKTTFNGTATAATSSVRNTAARVSGAMMASIHPVTPWRKASTRTIASGSTRNSTRNATETEIKAQRATAPSVKWTVGSRLASVIAAMPDSTAAEG